MRLRKRVEQFCINIDTDSVGHYSRSSAFLYWQAAAALLSLTANELAVTLSIRTGCVSIFLVGAKKLQFTPLLS